MRRKENEDHGERRSVIEKAEDFFFFLRYGGSLPSIEDTPQGVSIGNVDAHAYVSINYHDTGSIDFLKHNADRRAVLREGAVIFALLEDDGRSSGSHGYLSSETAQFLHAFREKYCRLPSKYRPSKKRE